MKQLLLTLVILISTLSSCTKHDDPLPDNGLPTTGTGLKSLNIGLEHFEADSIQPLLLSKSTIILQLRGDNPSTSVKLNAMVERNGGKGGHLRVEDPQLTQLPLQKYYLTSIIYFRNDISNPTKGGSTMDTLSVGLGIDITNPNDIKITNSYNNVTGTYGEGTESDPIVISSAEQFKSLIITPVTVDKTSLAGVHFRLAMDKLSLYELVPLNGNWKPIGISSANEYTSFSGIIDGAGCVIDGLKSDVQDYSGLFYSLESATIKNLEMTNVSLSSRFNIGALAYQANNSTIDNVTIAGTIKCDGTTGGFFAKAAGTTITNSRSRMSIDNYGGEGQDIGGFVGLSGSITLEKCSRDDIIVLRKSSYVGGLIGRASSEFNNGSRGSVKIDQATLVGDIIALRVAGGVVSKIENMDMTVSSVYLGIKSLNDNTFYSSLPKKENAEFVALQVNGNNYSGGFAGEILNCTVSLSTFKAANGDNSMGNENAVSGFSGGLIGFLQNSTLQLNNVTSCGYVWGEYGGGLIGFCENTPITLDGANEINNAQIGGAKYAGGVAGYMKGGSVVSSSIATVDVVSNILATQNGASVGLLFGFCGDLSQSLDLAKVTLSAVNVQGSKYTGGLIGEAYNIAIANSKSTPTFKLSGNAVSIGGLVGYGSNTTISNCSFSVDMDTQSSALIGGVIGSADKCTIDNMTVSSAIFTLKKNDEIEPGAGNLGGIMGRMLSGENNISNVTVVSLKMIGDDDIREGIGGIVGAMGFGTSGHITNACVESGVALTGPRNIGGIVGQTGDNSSFHITSCVNRGTVTYHDSGDGYNSGFGGVLGRNCGNVYISKSGNKGSVKGNYDVGGIVGIAAVESYKETRITECYNEGVIDGTGNIGGLVGYAREDMTIINCYNAAVIADGNSAGHTYVAGLVGVYYYLNNTNELHYCFNTSASGFGTVGGVASSDEDKISAKSTYYANNGGDYEYKNNHTYGIPMDKERLTDQSAFSGYDFNSIWKMGNSHPELRNATY